MNYLSKARKIKTKYCYELTFTIKSYGFYFVFMYLLIIYFVDFPLLVLVGLQIDKEDMYNNYKILLYVDLWGQDMRSVIIFILIFYWHRTLGREQLISLCGR